MSAPSTASAVPDNYQDMVHTMCAAVDSHDFERFGSFFADSAYYRFANNDPIHGREAIVAATATAAEALPSLRHVVDQVARIDDQLFCRFTIEVGEHSMPCVTVIYLIGGQIADYRVHMDISPALPGDEA